MLCGDETGGIVIDTGSSFSKFGFAGDDTPKAVFDTRVGVTHVPEDTSASKAGASSKRYTVGPGIRIPKPGMDIRSPVDFGIIEDWDAMENVWEYGFQQLLRTSDVGDHPVLLSEPPHSILAQREKIAEICFEKFGVPAMFLARSAVLGAFSAGRSSAIVVDIGASGTRVTPVYDGYVLTKGAHLSEVGGNLLSEALHQAILRQGLVPEIPARYSVKKSARTDSADTAAHKKFDVTHVDISGLQHSFKSWAELEVVDDLKKSLCEVHETGYDETNPPEAGSYELPDGQVIKIKDLRQQIPELLFKADAIEPYKAIVSSRSTPAWLYHFQAQVTIRHSTKDGGASPYPVPLQQAIYAALLSSAAEIRRDMCNNVILTGGGSNLRDIHKRLHWELLALIPAAFKPRVVAPAAIEREFANWIGGSILASLGTFQQMWVSKLEYEDEGPAAVERKCTT